MIWVGVSIIRRTNHPAASLATTATPTTAPTALRPSPQDVLADRLARGDIDPDDYRQRLDALRQTRPE